MANTQKILASLNAILAHGDAAQSFFAVRTEIISLCQELEGTLRNEIASSRGVRSSTKVLAAVLKGVGNERPALKYPWIDAEGRQCVTDGLRAFRLHEHLPLIERPDNAGDTVDLSRVYPADVSGMKELPMPEAHDVKSFIALDKARNGKSAKLLWSFGEAEPTVNAQYLLDIITVFPDATKLFWSNLVSPLYVPSEKGDALLCPIRDTSKAMKREEPAEKPAENKPNDERDERAEIISKAHADYEAACKEIIPIVKQQKEILRKRNNATSSGIIAEYDARLIELGKAEAKVYVKAHVAELVFNPDAAIEFDRFEYIIGKRHGTYIGAPKTA